MGRSESYYPVLNAATLRGYIGLRLSILETGFLPAEAAIEGLPCILCETAEQHGGELYLPATTEIIHA